MDHFIMLPMTENGFVKDSERMRTALKDAMIDPFQFTDLFIYSHGWWTTANASMVQYSQYTVEFVKQLATQSTLPHRPKSSFGIGVHWPSTFSEDYNGGIVGSLVQGSSYYEMGMRAFQVGMTGVYATIRLLLSTRFHNHDANKPIRLTILGHSFGCRVVCSALETLWREANQPDKENFKEFLNRISINLVLMQGAVKTTDFVEGGRFAELPKIRGLRFLLTRSDKDIACGKWFPRAETLNNFAHFNLKDVHAEAIGTVGPPDGMVAKLGGKLSIDVGADFKGSFLTERLTPDIRLVDADLTKLHEFDNDNDRYTPDDFGGNHSDISQPEIFELISAFAFHLP
ncbi:MAG: hypothetical protein KC652_05475 [Cyanobacteria bacterium HKST-UBA01]|nr:hypothetical protein [Cyanobacteria bacterium HKST-UBA01]